MFVCHVRRCGLLATLSSGLPLGFEGNFSCFKIWRYPTPEMKIDEKTTASSGRLRAADLRQFNVCLGISAAASLECPQSARSHCMNEVFEFDCHWRSPF